MLEDRCVRIVRKRRGRMSGIEMLPLTQVGKNCVENGDESETRRRSCTLSTAIGTDKLGTLTVLRNDDSLDDFADEIGLDGMNEVKVCVTVVNDGMDERSPIGICGRVCNMCKPAPEVAKAGGFNELGLSDG